MATSRGFQLRLPKPKTFLGLLSLQTGTEITTIILLLNKVTGLYGLLAILTGYALDAVQLSMYLYSTACLAVLAYLLPHIREHSPFQVLFLAWLYIIDTALNAAYTTCFAVQWYTHPELGSPTGDAAVQATDTAASMALIVFFTLVRVYLMFVVMSFARQVVRRYAGSLAGDKGGMARPFALGTAEGEGWKGKLGRTMVFVGEEYWIGDSEDEERANGREGSAVRVPLAGAVDWEE